MRGSLLSRAWPMLTTAPLAVVFIWVGASNILALKRGADVSGLARLIETASAGPASGIGGDLLERIGLASDFEALHAICLDEISRSAMTVQLARLENARSTGDPETLAGRGAMARTGVDRRLACAPADGNAWFYRARLLDEFGGDARDVATALRVSYRAAPAEKWIMVPRFAFVAPRVEEGETSVLAEFESDLVRLANALPPAEMAELYIGIGPRVRAMMASEIRRQPAGRRAFILASIDRLGVTLK